MISLNNQMYVLADHSLSKANVKIIENYYLNN